MSDNLNDVTADWARKQVYENKLSAHNKQLASILTGIRHKVTTGKPENYLVIYDPIIPTVKADLEERGFTVDTKVSEGRNETNHTSTITW